MTDAIRGVIVTGSYSGIRLDIARALLGRGAGVVLNGRDPGRLARAAAGLGLPDGGYVTGLA